MSTKGKKVKPIDFLKEKTNEFGITSVDQIKSQSIKFIEEWDFTKARRRKYMKTISQVLALFAVNVATAIVSYLLG